MTFKDYILYQLNDIKEGMIIAISDLPEEELISFEPCNHWPIAWNVQICCGIVDLYIYKHITGYAYLKHDIDPIKVEPKPGDTYPELDELLERGSSLMDASIREITKLSDDELINCTAKKCFDALRALNLHLRSIWCILGEKRIDKKWPIENTCML